MKLRQMAAAFIYRDGKYVMIKKTSSKLSESEFWSGLGGHMEAHEINDPVKACLREVYEESGIRAEEIVGLKLRYLLLRQKEDEIRVQYVFFGRTMKKDLVSSDEGELFWINEDEIYDRNMSSVIREMLRHYKENQASEAVFVGTMTKTEGQEAAIQWSVMQDPLVF
jgi:8-oxo-dGTP diphosphatase